MQLKGQTSEFGAKEKFGRKVFKERWVGKREQKLGETQEGRKQGEEGGAGKKVKETENMQLRMIKQSKRAQSKKRERKKRGKQKVY